MCFFKTKLPEVVTPNTQAAVPDNATAVEPQAPVFGGTEQDLVASGETGGKTGISSLKIKNGGKQPALSMPVTTGANTSMGFNG